MPRPRELARRALRLERLEAREVPATFTVTSALDAGGGSLREAVGLANAAPGPDIITFAVPANTTIALASALPVITGAVTFDGPGVGDKLNVARSAGAATDFRVFDVQTNDLVNPVVFEGLLISGGRLTDGSAGAGVRVVNSKADFVGAIVFENANLGGSGGGVAVDATSVVSFGASTAAANSTSSKGGGIYSEGNLTVLISVIEGNIAAASGGGVSAAGTTAVTASTVAANDAPNAAGVSNDAGTIALTNVTIANNVNTQSAAPAFGLSVAGGGTAEHLTVVGNKGGVSVGGALTLRNSIAAGNAGAADVLVTAGAATLDTNLVGTTATPGGTLSSANPVAGLARLAPLGDYGAPVPTIALLPDSIAIDSGAVFAGSPSVDARALGRVGAPDLGAFESRGFTVGGGTQSTQVSTAFPNPLTATVTPNDAREPVNGGNLNFSATPAGGGASATLSGAAVTIASGAASVTATANSVAGSYTATATARGVTSPGTFNLTNTAAPLTAQTITFNPLSNVVYGVAPFGLSATATSGLPVTFTVVSGPATWNGTTLSVSAVGTVVVRADQAGNGTFSAAPPVQQSFGVTPAPLTVSGIDTARVYGAANPALAFTSAGLVNGDTAAGVLSGALATVATAASGVGTYAITQGTLVANANYTLTFTNANLFVTPAPLNVTADDQTRTYGAANPALTFTATGFVNGDTAAVLTGALETAATAASGVGAYAITQGALAGANYAITFTGDNLAVTPAPLGVTANAQARLYGAANPALTFGATGFVNGDTAAGVLSGVLSTPATAGSNVGTYAIAQGTLAASGNYALTYTGADLTVTAAPLSVVADAQSRAVGAANPPRAFAATGVVNGDTQAAVLSGALSTTATPASAPGSYPIAQGALAANANYAITYTGANLVVGQATLTVTVSAQTRLYGAANPALTFTATGFVNGDTAATALTGVLATLATAGSGVGTYAITQGTLAADAEYTLVFVGADLSVTPAPLTVSAVDISRVYGSSNPALAFTTAGLVNGDTAAGVLTGAPSTAATAGSGVGTYAITQGTVLANGNYALTFGPGELTVTPAPLTLAVADATRVYGDPNPVFNIVPTGLVNGDTLSTLTGTPTFGTPATPGSDVGAYPVTPSGLSNPNYAITFVAGDLTVTPAVLTVTANDVTRVYGDVNPPLDFVTEGLRAGDTATEVLTGALDTPAMTTSDAGTYPIGVGTLGTNPNYTLAFAPGELTVTPATLRIVPNDVSIRAGDPVPPLTARFEGFRTGDGPDDVTGLRLATPGDGSEEGVFPITASGAVARNYVIEYGTGSEVEVAERLLVRLLAAGAGDGGGPAVKVYNADGSVRFAFFAFESSFRGGVTVATGDVTGDGFEDIIAGAGVGGGPRVRVFDGVTGKQLADFFAYDSSFRGGVNVGAGDTDGDGVGEVVSAPGLGGGPLVRVWDTRTFTQLRQYLAYAADFRGGALVAVGDLDGDGVGEILTGAGPRGGPHVRVVNGLTLADEWSAFAYDPDFRGGARVAATDEDGDGVSDMTTGAGPRGGPHVREMRGTDGADLGSYFAYDPDFRGGAWVAPDAVELATGPGTGGGPHLREWESADPVRGIFAFEDTFRGGVHVG